MKPSNTPPIFQDNRSTNLELFRIITMLLIIAHHYVVNSGLWDTISQNPTSIKSLFLTLYGAWGKTGINCFVLITGYFMCKSSVTARKVIKLLAEIIFYKIVINTIFCFIGYQEFSTHVLLQFIPLRWISTSFTDAFIVLMLFIPFINILLHNLTEKQHIKILLLSSYVYIFMGTLKNIFGVIINYVSWFIVLYFFASYIRLYPKKIFTNTKLWGILTLVSIILSSLSVVLCAFLGKYPYLFVTDSNTFLAFATGFNAFMFFKNVRIPYNKFINTMASTCFGVLLIHANSNTMRTWLWKDVLNNVEVFSKSWMPFHALGSVIMIFLICSFIDFLRILFFEKPFLRMWDKYWPHIFNFYTNIEKKFFKLLGI